MRFFLIFILLNSLFSYGQSLEDQDVNNDWITCVQEDVCEEFHVSKIQYIEYEYVKILEESELRIVLQTNWNRLNRICDELHDGRQCLKFTNKFMN